MSITLATVATAIGALAGAAGLWYQVARWIDPNHAMEKAIDRKERGDRVADHLTSMGEHEAAEAARKIGQIAVLERLERTILSREHWWWPAAMILTLVLIMFGVGIATLPDSSPEQVLLGVYSIEAGIGLGVLCFLYGLVVELIVWRRAERRYQDRVATAGPGTEVEAVADAPTSGPTEKQASGGAEPAPEGPASRTAAA